MSGFVSLAGGGIIGDNDFATAINFNSNRYLERGGVFTDALTSNSFVFSIWFNPSAVNNQCLFSAMNTSGSHPVIDIRFVNDKNLQLTFASDASTSNYIRAAYSQAETFINKWTHLLMRLILSSGTIATYELFVDDTAKTFDNINKNNAGIDQFTFAGANSYIGRGIGNGALSLTNTFCDGVCIAEPFLAGDTGGFGEIDEEMRRKFITEDLKPVYLGDAGELPNGTSQLLYLSNPLATWQNNRGKGGGMTIQGGGLSLCGSAP